MSDSSFPTSPDCPIDLLPGEVLRNVKAVPRQRSVRPDPKCALGRLRRKLNIDFGVRDWVLGEPSVPVASASTTPDEQRPELRAFEAIFGRDALIMSRFLWALDPALGVGALLALAQCQGRVHDVASEQEPGRIAHEIRDPADPVAVSLSKSNGWSWPYYGSVDATPRFISHAACVLRQLPSLTRLGIRHATAGVRTVGQAIDDASLWLAQRLEQDDGYLVSRPLTAGALVNQVWRDSWDAFFEPDGAVAGPPIVALDAQCLAFDALVEGASIARMFPGVGAVDPRRLEWLADLVKRRTIEKFVQGGDVSPWFACALHRRPGALWKPLLAHTSDQGHLLGSRLLASHSDRPDLVAGIVADLSSDNLLCAAGLRTIGLSESRFRAGAYHCGSSWLWDTATTAFGLVAEGELDFARDLFGRVEKACDVFGGYPEFARGERGSEIHFNTRVVDVVDRQGRENRIEQPPQEIQGWTVAAYMAIEHYHSTGQIPS